MCPPSQGVREGAILSCTFGVAPSTLHVIPPLRDANIMDNRSVTNVPPFGMCRSMANPTVIAASAAAHGALTPMPCVPAIVSPWVPGDPMKLANGVPALTQPSRLTCAYAGIISIVGQP